MKLITLLENTTCRPDLTKEHGLSLYIETNGHKILFDMGQTDAFASNAEKLGVDLSAVDIAILSHGHYDHGGGLSAFLEQNQKAPVYISCHAFGDFHNGTEKYIGLNPALKQSDRLVFVGNETKLDENLTLLSCNEKLNTTADTQIPTTANASPLAPANRSRLSSHGLTQKIGDDFLPDTFLHEHYLLIEENGKRILISGCSHKGIADLVSWFEPDVLVGGFHLKHLTTEGADADVLRNLAETLLSYPTKYYTGHCTGKEQFAFLKSLMGERLEAISTGQVLEL